jgi:hypothetical protein
MWARREPGALPFSNRPQTQALNGSFKSSGPKGLKNFYFPYRINFSCQMGQLKSHATFPGKFSEPRGLLWCRERDLIKSEQFYFHPLIVFGLWLDP